MFGKRKGKHVQDESDLPEPANVPDYSKPKPPPMGEVEGPSGPALGGIEPKVTFTQESLPSMPDRPDRPEVQPPTADEIAAMKWYYQSVRANMMQQVAVIEDMLGFVDVCDDLAVRIAKLEKFVGIK